MLKISSKTRLAKNMSFLLIAKNVKADDGSSNYKNKTVKRSLLTFNLNRATGYLSSNAKKVFTQSK